MTLHTRILYIFLFCITAAASLAAQPALRLNTTAVNLGIIYHGEKKTVPLIARNIGTLPLTITNVETSCGCTSAKRSTEPIAPGMEDTISVTFNSLGFFGGITKIVSVYSNDPAQPQVEARLTGTVTSLIETVPPMQVINFGGSAVGKSAPVSFLFKNTTSDSVTIRSITCADSSFRSSFSSGVISPNSSVSILFSFTPAARSFVENYFYIETTDPRQTRIPFRFMYLGQ